MKKFPNSDKPFKVDNTVLQNVAAQTAPLRKPRGEFQQLSMPGFGILTPLDECVIYACYYFAEHSGDYTGRVEVSLTDFADRLAYERHKLGQTSYTTFESNVYQEITDALCRLFSATLHYILPYKGHVYSMYLRFLQEFAYRYPGDLYPETVPPHMRRNVNPYSEDYAVWAIEGRRPNGIVFRLSSSLTQGILGQGQNIGYSLMPPLVFEIRHTPGGSRITTRLLTWVIRQTNKTVKISLKKLRSQLHVVGRNVSRDRDSIVKGLQLLKDRNVIEDFSIDSRDMVTIHKATPAEKQLPETTG